MHPLPSPTTFNAGSTVPSLSDHRFYMSTRYQLVAEMKDAIWRHLAGREAAQQSHKVGVKYRDRHQLGSSGCFSGRQQCSDVDRNTKH